MHKLASKIKFSTSGFSLYLENLYPIPKMHRNSLLRNFLNYYYLSLKASTNNNLIQEYILNNNN